MFYTLLKGTILKKNYNARRRGTSVAAAALSFALVAPFAQPVAVAQEAVATAADANLEDAIEASAQIIDADPIASQRVTRPDHLTNPFGVGYGLLSGHVTEATPGDALSANPRTSGGTGGLPAPEGTYVYAQFRDVDGSVSPIFRTQVHNLEGTIVGLNGGQGTFAFGLPEVEEQIEVPEVTAEPGTPEYEEQLKAQEEAAKRLEEQQAGIPESVSGTKRRGGMEWVDANGKVHRFHAHPAQQYRLWVDPYENERGQLVEPFRQVNGITPGSFVGVTTGQNNGAWPNSRASMTLTGMVMKERPAEWMVGPDSPVMKDAVHDEQGPVSNPDTTTELDRYIAGNVWLEAGNGTSTVNAPNEDGRDRPAAGYRVYAATLTREGAIANEEIKNLEDPAERTAATRKMLEDHPEYILKTVWGTTDQEGNYTLRFDDAENSSTEDTDYWDPNNLFMWVTDPSGEKVLPTYSPYLTNSFYHFNDNTSWSSGKPYWRPARKAVNNAHFGVMVNELQELDITNFDAFANPASPGDTAEISVSGTFPPFDAESDWVNVVWRDSKGNELKRCYQIGTAAQASECSLEIPEGTADGEIITASLEIGGRVVSADSLAVVDRERDNAKYTPEYSESEVSQDPPKPLVIDAPTNTQPDADGNVQPLPDGTKFAPGNQVVGPEGPMVDNEGTPVFPDWIRVNEDGTIEVNPTEDTPVGDYKVPVTVTYPDGTRETIYADVKVTPKLIEPAYEDKLVVPGDPATSTPRFFEEDENGKPTEVAVEAPEGSKFAISEDFEAPEGYTVDIDENTGVITVTAPEELDAETVEDFDVPVVVTYPDDSEDDATAKFELDTDGDGTPDSKDDDDDNDGISDEEEKEKGSNPKDKGSIPATPIEPGNPTDAATVEPAYEDTPVVPGTPAESEPTFTDKDGKETEAPEGTEFAISEDFEAPEGYTVDIDENTGVITVTAPEELDAETVEDFDVPVVVTYPDDSEDDATAKFELDTDGDGTPDSKDDDDDNDGISDEEEKEKGSNPKDKGSIPAMPLVPGTKNPDWDDSSTTPGTQVTVPKKDGSGDVPEGSTVEVEGPGTAELDENGNIVVTPSEDAKPGDKIKVVVKDKDGTELDTIEVEITAPDTTQAETFDPNYEELTQVTVDGNKATNNPFGEDDAPLKNIDSKASDGSQDWEFQMQENGVIVATAPTMAEVGEAVGEELPAIDKSWEKFVETFTPYARPTVTVDFTYEDDSKDEGVDANFDLLGKDGKSLLDPDGDFDGDGVSNRDEIEGESNPADETSKPSEGDDVKDTTPPTVNPITEGDKTISGTGDRPNEKIIIELPGGQKVETETDKDGKWTIDVPADVELKPGDKVIVSDGAGNSTTEQVGIDTGKCVATSLGFGLPLLALIPLGLASQMEIPGLSNVVADANAQLQAANTRIQQQLGLFNPGIAAQVDAANRQLAQFGTDLGTVAGGLALIAAGILAGTLIYDNCSPNGGGSSVKDLQLKGSSGNTYAGSSKKDGKDAESGSSKKDDKANEQAADKK